MRNIAENDRPKNEKSSIGLYSEQAAISYTTAIGKNEDLETV